MSTKMDTDAYLFGQTSRLDQFFLHNKPAYNLPFKGREGILTCPQKNASLINAGKENG